MSSAAARPDQLQPDQVKPDQTWLRRFHKAKPDAPRLICFPHAGGSASYFYAFSDQLAPDVEMFAVQYPGRQDRIAEPRRSRWPAGRPAGRRHRAAGLRADGVLRAQLRLGAVLRGGRERGAARYGSGGPVRVRIPGALADPQRLGAPPGRRGPGAGAAGTRRHRRALARGRDVLAAILPPLRTDYRLIETHQRTSEQLDGVPLTMFTGEDDPHTTLDEAEAWREATTGEFTLEVFSGGHFYLDDHLPALAQSVRTRVEQVVCSGAARQDQA